MVFAKDALFSRGSTKRISLINRLRDYVGLRDAPTLFSLHRKMSERLFFDRTWQSHDYGEGYFYQSFDRIGVRGLRDTKARVEAMGLRDLLRGKHVIDIGSNAGFLSLSLADVAKEVVGLENNPDLVAVGNLARDYLRVHNVTFVTSSFEDFTTSKVADVILSFANHSTYDGNTKQSVEEYFEKCKRLLHPGGLLIFESHHPTYESPEALQHVVLVIERLFHIRERKVLMAGTFFDRGRTYIVAERS
ncbi:MAG: hypothetical protein A2849_01175 [Candidatus Taylorbacteria bacterium RIFCSPHIGHO2_01_FULL_51_15]|uniref:Methyltransferase domain-containing protein n=1 Tax=Candidatus Taylorbacteria bacterium RIFCSPHIGHO2_01_FULL_51_15 TaxID=1802304 RepID=A0A1G2MBH4_9BACT|nr:MAG: hypothetical protein A2849_01175 [Candidatus Taylorbacteria bacterium RIFCSPHIGHO2_01_FULL_51_15]